MVAQAAILRIAEQVRREQSVAAGQGWSVGLCQFVAQVLTDRLAAVGYSPRRIEGYYTRPWRPATPAGGTNSPVTTWDGVWKHWWVECDGFVIDVMADRFGGPNSPAPEIVVVPTAAARDYHATLPRVESPHHPSGGFEQ